MIPIRQLHFCFSFDCCSLASPLLTPLGKCYTIDLSRSSKASMHKQTEPGIQAGLQITLDAHIEEQFDEENDMMPALFTNSFVDGFRYFVHPPNTVPHLASDEFTVSPNSVAYSAISSDRVISIIINQFNCFFPVRSPRIPQLGKLYKQVSSWHSVRPTVLLWQLSLSVQSQILPR